MAPKTTPSDTMAPSDAAEEAGVSGLPTRERILAITAGLFARHGFNGVGMAEIGAAVGLGRGALYHHIRSKEDLLYDIMTAYMTDLLSGGAAIVEAVDDPETRIRRLSRHLIATIARHLSELTVCFREVHALTGDRQRAVLKLHADYQALWAGVLRDGAAKGVFAPVEGVVLKGLLGMYFYSFLWLNPHGAQSPESIGDAFAEVVLKAVRRS